MKPLIALTSFAMILTIADLPAEPVPAESPAPQIGSVAGHGDGSGFRPGDTKLPLRYPAPKQFGAHGTFSTWINLDDPSAATGSILSAGTPDRGWILLQVADGKLTFVLQRGVKPFAGGDESYVNISVPIDHWAPDSWHHIAVAWDARGPGQSLVALFFDGESVEERHTVSLAEEWGPETLFIGSSSASATAPRMAGTLDKVAVFPFAVPPDQLVEVMNGVAAGATLFVDFELGSDAEDLRLSRDDAAARAESRAKWAK